MRVHVTESALCTNHGARIDAPEFDRQKRRKSGHRFLANFNTLHYNLTFRSNDTAHQTSRQLTYQHPGLT